MKYLFALQLCSLLFIAGCGGSSDSSGSDSNQSTETSTTNNSQSNNSPQIINNNQGVRVKSIQITSNVTYNAPELAPYSTDSTTQITNSYNANGLITKKEMSTIFPSETDSFDIRYEYTFNGLNQAASEKIFRNNIIESEINYIFNGNFPGFESNEINYDNFATELFDSEHIINTSVSNVTSNRVTVVETKDYTADDYADSVTTTDYEWLENNDGKIASRQITVIEDDNPETLKSIDYNYTQNKLSEVVFNTDAESSQSSTTTFSYNAEGQLIQFTNNINDGSIIDAILTYTENGLLNTVKVENTSEEQTYSNTMNFTWEQAACTDSLISQNLTSPEFTMYAPLIGNIENIFIGGIEDWDNDNASLFAFVHCAG